MSRAAQSALHHDSPLGQLEAAVLTDTFVCPSEELGALIHKLQEKKAALEVAEAESNLDLLLQFLQFSRCVCVWGGVCQGCVVCACGGCVRRGVLDAA